MLHQILSKALSKLVGVNVSLISSTKLRCYIFRMYRWLVSFDDTVIIIIDEYVTTSIMESMNTVA